MNQKYLEVNSEYFSLPHKINFELKYKLQPCSNGSVMLTKHPGVDLILACNKANITCYFISTGW